MITSSSIITRVMASLNSSREQGVVELTVDGTGDARMAIAGVLPTTDLEFEITDIVIYPPPDPPVPWVFADVKRGGISIGVIVFLQGQTIDLGDVDPSLDGATLQPWYMGTGDFEEGDVYTFEASASIPVPHFVGEACRAQHDAPPRIVWVPTRDSYGAARRIGQEERAFRTRLSGWEVDVWDVTMDAAETLVNDLHVAIHRVVLNLWGSPLLYEVTGGTWLTAGEVAALGYCCRLDVVFSIPVGPGGPAKIQPTAFTLTKTVTAP